jgi:hypothetical protein
MFPTSTLHKQDQAQKTLIFMLGCYNLMAPCASIGKNIWGLGIRGLLNRLAKADITQILLESSYKMQEEDETCPPSWL